MIGWIIIIIGFLLIFYFILTADNERSEEKLNNEFAKVLDIISKNQNLKPKQKDSAPEFYDVLQDLKQGKNPTEDLLDKTTQKNIFIILSWQSTTRHPPQGIAPPSFPLKNGIASAYSSRKIMGIADFLFHSLPL